MKLSNKAVQRTVLHLLCCVPALWLLYLALTDGLGRAIRQLTGVQVPADAWQLDAVPDHLRVRFRVTVPGRDPVVGRDLAALKAAVLKRDHGSYTSQEEIQAQIKSVESEIQQQKAALSGAKTVTAKASGTYSAVCDGYESVLTPEVLETMTPSQLSSAAPQRLIIRPAWRDFSLRPPPHREFEP